MKERVLDGVCCDSTEHRPLSDGETLGWAACFCPRRGARNEGCESLCVYVFVKNFN